MALFISCFLQILLALSWPTANGWYDATKLLYDATKTVSFTAGSMTPFAAVAKIAAANRIPVGIIIGVHSLLCVKPRPIAVDKLTIQQALIYLTRETGYTVSNENGVYIITAPDVTEYEQNLLQYKFAKFTASKSTIGDAGALLAGYIISVVEGAGGFATDTLSNPSIPLFDINMQNATTKEIANRIVTLEGKGAWIFRPTADAKPASTHEIPIKVFGYADNAEDLQENACKGFTLPTQ